MEGSRIDAATQTDLPAPTLRRWQKKRPFTSHHLILGWAITPEMYWRFCTGDSRCPTYLHGKPGGYDDDYHEEALQEVACDLLGERYQLPCAGYKLVYVDPTLHHRDIEFAWVLTDNQGRGEAQRSLPDPAIVDAMVKVRRRNRNGFCELRSRDGSSGALHMISYAHKEAEPVRAATFNI